MPPKKKASKAQAKPKKPVSKVTPLRREAKAKEKAELEQAHEKKAIQQKAERPTLIDERDGACELCAAHQNGKCDNCGKSIPFYPNMDGHGYATIKPSHYHVEKVGGLDGRSSRFGELCQECYKKHRAEVYPDEKEWQPS